MSLIAIYLTIGAIQSLATFLDAAEELKRYRAESVFAAAFIYALVWPLAMRADYRNASSAHQQQEGE